MSPRCPLFRGFTVPQLFLEGIPRLYVVTIRGSKVVCVYVGSLEHGVSLMTPTGSTEGPYLAAFPTTIGL